MYHYDVIIYDRLNSPILWIDDNQDQSPQGKRRAIPAEHVYGVFEVKSQLTTAHAKSAIRKLGEINQLSTHLPKTFISSIIFFELDSTMANKPRMLEHLHPDQPIIGYWGGLILRCDINPVMTGLFKLIRDESTSHAQDGEGRALVKDVDTVDVWMTERGSITLAHGAAIFLYADGQRLHPSKMYVRVVTKTDHNGVALSWSYNNYSSFVIKLLLALEGKSWRDGEPQPATFGYVFDKLEIRAD